MVQKTVVRSPVQFVTCGWTSPRMHTDTLHQYEGRKTSRCHVEGFIACKWKKQDTDGAYPPFAPLEESCERQTDTKGHGNKIHDLIRHTMLLCGADASR